jgi:hypothetical protein
MVKTSGPASEVNDWRLRLLSIEICFIVSFTYYKSTALKSSSFTTDEERECGGVSCSTAEQG